MPKDLSKLSPRDLAELSGVDDEEILNVRWRDQEFVVAQGDDVRRP